MATPHEIVSQARRDVATERLIGVDGPPVIRRHRRQLELLIRDARTALRELAELEAHTCQWNENDYCNVCGADGRA